MPFLLDGRNRAVLDLATVVMRIGLLGSLLLSPALAHPGDHTFLRLTMRAQVVDAELDVPASFLAELDGNGDFLITPEEGQERLGVLRRLVEQGLEVSADGLTRAPASLSVVPRPLWLTPPEDLLRRADQSVTLKLSYRWPWTLRHVRVRYRWFSPSPVADCALQLSAFGATRTQRLTPAASEFGHGTPRLWLGLIWGALQPAPWLAWLGLTARAGSRVALLAAVGWLTLGTVLPGSGWGGALACLALAAWRGAPPWWLAPVLLVWFPGPARGAAPLCGSALAALLACLAGRRLSPDQGVICLLLAAALSFLF